MTRKGRDGEPPAAEAGAGAANEAAAAGPLTLFLCGDVMCGRGIDQILRQPSAPRLCEPHVTSAGDYVALAEARHGSLPRGVGADYVWGVAPAELARAGTEAAIANLETSVTTSEHCLPKGINYRMNPANAALLAAPGIDCYTLANNHVLDWGRDGLVETLAVLADAGLRVAGAGLDADAAAAPAAIPLRRGGRVLVFAYGLPSSGVPADWAAGAGRPGVNFLPDLSAASAARVAGAVGAARRPGDIVVASLHWGGNWGYEVPAEERDFAHRLIDSAGVDVVHGHSAHHAKAIEVYGGRLILYGCGDFLNDYEGIGGYEGYRDDLAIMYLARIEPDSGRLAGLAMRPLRIRRFSLEHAGRDDTVWIQKTLARQCRAFGGDVTMATDGSLELVWQ